MGAFVEFFELFFVCSPRSAVASCSLPFLRAEQRLNECALRS